MSKCRAEDCNREVGEYAYCSIECSIYHKEQGKDKVIFSEYPHDHQCPKCLADIRLVTLDCPNPRCDNYRK